MGKIDGFWIEETRKLEILEVISSAKKQGVSVQHSCRIMGINRGRIVRWQSSLRRGQGLSNAQPGFVNPPHRLLEKERLKILETARMTEYADLSHRILTVTACEENLFFASFSTVYRVLSSEGLMTQRGHQRQHNGRSIAPYRRPLSGPNQRWCWDISYLYTYEKGLYLYLYLLLDEYSRKTLSWVVSWRQDAGTALQLLDNGLVKENILDLDEEERPEIFNDRGRQMKAKPVRKLLEDHAMPQIFSRPRTPDDNPFIESAFGSTKRFHKYPGRFLDQQEAQEYFSEYFRWYNESHYHSGIDFVTPQQAHAGMREQIVAQRRQKLDRQRRYRQKINRALKGGLAPPSDGSDLTCNQPQLCSVINC